MTLGHFSANSLISGFHSSKAVTRSYGGNPTGYAM
eukprot:CAMPEP_0113577934 /NCGR_PEP_ID=MMETSP0015_2-20120614/29168_1 /TAXON_ID=2838 /ORGANISM="Odontella" /LENGTH=34 /DNA_ID=CAMNT_0000481617 /DNA_START=261 /DNA_END=365 /DNA_ORIENTATION=- /assembly_acc=CAM_ASM_000160